MTRPANTTIIAAERHPAMHDLTEALAAELGTGWTAVDGGHFMALDGPDGQHLTLLPLARQRDRLQISGALPWQARNATQPDPHVITVAADRTPVSIAADITRRLLPAYAPAARAAREVARRTAAAADARRARADALAARFGGAVREGDEHTTYVDFFGDGGGQRGTIRLQRDGAQIDLELERVPAEILLALGADPAAIEVGAQP